MKMTKVLAILLCSVCCVMAAEAAASAAVPEKKAPDCKCDVSLQLPPAIYAVPGIECNVYFDNIVLVINQANFVFDVDCRKGENRQDCWSYIPKAEDVGTYDWSIKVISQCGTVAQASMKLIVVPENAGEGKDISVVVFGDSLTNATVYPTRIHDNFQKPHNPTLLMGGSNGPGNKPGVNGVAHEGWGGWTWATFTTKKEPSKVAKPQPYHRASALFFEKNGEKVLDVAEYFKTYNHGRKPDIITFQLGVNDVFSRTDDNLQDGIKIILANAEKLIALCRAAAPEAIIGVGLVTPGCATQDGFAASYQSGQTRWQYKKNQHALNQAMLKLFANYKDAKLSIIPTNVNLDCVNNFPMRAADISQGNPRPGYKRQCNGVHPSKEGYNQIGDTFYAWMKYQLSLQGK